MFSAVTYHHPDGTPMTDAEVEAVERARAENERQARIRNQCYYTEQKNQERQADALELIAESLESIAGDLERLTDFILTTQSMKGETNHAEK